MNSFTINKIKTNELKTIGHYTGYVCIVIGLFMIIPIICAIIFHDEVKYLNSFVSSSIICVAIGFLLWVGFSKKNLTHLSLKGSLIFVLSIWGLTALAAGLPYVISGDLNILDAFFEGMSGITTTGFSLLPPCEHPFSVAIWASLTQWLGGLGIIVLLLVVVPSSVSLKRLYFAEGRTEQMTPNIKHTTIIFIKLYLLLTSIGIILYLLAGLNLFDAICYCFCGIATGGFSVHPANVQYFQTPIIQLITMCIMILGGLNFVVIYRVIKGAWRNLYKDIEIKAFAFLVISSTLLIGLSLYFQGFYNHDILLILRHSLFQVVSVITSTGFSSTSIDNWSPLCYTVLILLMFTGSSICSTSGGIKLYNIVILFKAIWWEVKSMILPKNTIIIKKVFHDNKYRDVSDKTIKTILIYVISYILIFIASFIVIAIFCNDFQIAFTITASSLGNTGLAPTYLSVSTPLIVKIVMIIDFWAGRIGVWPLLLSIVYTTNIIQGKIEEHRE